MTATAGQFQCLAFGYIGKTENLLMRVAEFIRLRSGIRPEIRLASCSGILEIFSKPHRLYAPYLNAPSAPGNQQLRLSRGLFTAKLNRHL